MAIAQEPGVDGTFCQGRSRDGYGQARPLYNVATLRDEIHTLLAQASLVTAAFRMPSTPLRVLGEGATLRVSCMQSSSETTVLIRGYGRSRLWCVEHLGLDLVDSYRSILDSNRVLHFQNRYSVTKWEKAGRWLP